MSSYVGLTSYVGLNRRKGGERRIFDTHPGVNQRGADDRRVRANSYFFVMGAGGIDGFAASCLIMLAVVAMVATV